MTRLSVLWLFVMVAGLGAAENAAVGKWDCSSSDGSGQDQKWTLVVTEDKGKLSGAISGAPGDIPLLEPTLSGNLFTFKFVVNSNCTVEAKVRINGNRLEGRFACPEVSGTMKGVKQS